MIFFFIDICSTALLEIWLIALPNASFVEKYSIELIVLFLAKLKEAIYIRKSIKINHKRELKMAHIAKKQQNYAKWQDSIWNSVEKEISLFQKKVTDCMLQLGDLNKKEAKDFQVEPCLEEDVILGEEFYVELIRPVCVSKGYLPKKAPVPEDVADICFAEEEERLEKNEQKQKEGKEAKDKNKQKKGGGGKGKGGKASNEEQMKMKIVKENFQKDIELVMKSHSMERMQVEFGLKHKKLEFKLMTFFYVAFYIRKNKVSQKIGDAEVFELINILIKIVRIFSHLRGRSFVDHEREVEVSPTLVLDLKFCIKGLKEFYKYDNKVVMIQYPKLVYYTNYDRFFPTLDIKPYDSQVRFIQAVKQALSPLNGSLAAPTLVLYKTMIGSGKTSASIALSQLVRECKLKDGNKNQKMQLLYSCLIGSVRVQVGRYAYNKGQKFALAAMERSIKDPEFFYPRVINSWSCRNEKVVDLVISDLHCTYEMLDQPYGEERESETMDHERKSRKQAVNVGRLDRENVVLFIDEPTAFCKGPESPATQKLFEILANYPPKLIILASATMPAQSELPSTIQLIRRKNPKLQVFEVESQEFQIGCQYCSFKGEIIFPHTGVKSKAELNKIIELLKKNPFLMRLYTGPSLFHLLRKCSEFGMKNLPDVNNLPEIRQKDIIAATFRILHNLSKQQDELIEEVCKLSKSQDNLDFKEKVQHQGSDDEDFDFMQEEEEEDSEQEEVEREDYVDFKKMLKGDAHKFLGGCLIATSDPIEFATEMFRKWVRHIKPVKKLLEKYERDCEQLTKEIRLLEDDKEMREENKTKKISKLQAEREPVLDFPEKKKINTVEHYNRYCKSKEPTHQSMLIKPVPLENVGKELIEEADDLILKLLFCGVAVYAERGLSAKYLDKVEELASQNFLAYIISDESLCYGANFPISNVIIRDDLARKLNMNEMFQLIGRSGRVGQSWTARAFLEPHALKMLNTYIHDPDYQLSDEGRIFEQIAQAHLNDPVLRLRTNISEIRYLEQVENSQFVEILIKKKEVADLHILRKIVLVPYIKQNNGKVKMMTHKLPYASTNKYAQPMSHISYYDLPTVENEHGKQIVDVAFYYEKQQEFIKQTISNATDRLRREALGGVIGEAKQVNEFVAKEYVNFYNSETKAFTVMFECQKEAEFKQFRFEEVSGNPGQAGDDLVTERLKALLEEAGKLAPAIRSNPTGITSNEIKRAIQLHQDLVKIPKMDFYKDAFNHCLQLAEQEYAQVIETVNDKSLLEMERECCVILAVDRMQDVQNYSHKFYHIDKEIRVIWDKLSDKIQG